MVQWLHICIASPSGEKSNENEKDKKMKVSFVIDIVKESKSSFYLQQDKQFT